jgi:hypothetical protein
MEHNKPESDSHKTITVENQSSFTVQFHYIGKDKHKDKKCVSQIKSKEVAAMTVSKCAARRYSNWPWLLFAGLSLGKIKPNPDMLLDRWIQDCTIKIDDARLTGSFTIPSKSFNTITIIEENAPAYCTVMVDNQSYMFIDIDPLGSTPENHI